MVLANSGCRREVSTSSEHAEDHAHGEAGMLALPELREADLDGAPLRVVATTSIIGDVVARVGGNAIELTTLIGPGQDPHSYEPAAQDMVAVSRAHVSFVNGWDLEEALVQNLEDVGEDVPIVPVSANIEPLAFGGRDFDGEDAQGEQNLGHDEDEHSHQEGADPHTWFSIPNVEQWVENVERILSDLDPANARTYEGNAVAYRAELEELEAYVKAQLASIPPEKRVMVTNHDSFGYLAHEYDLEILGTVIPAASSMAEPSASDLAELIAAMREHGVCTLFTEATVSDKLAQMVAGELEGCEQVQVLKLYTGAVGPAGSGEDSYVGMMRYNVDTIVEGLK
jgi:ABC-type Zn uptake system ZnuABC Zn-binding protein ZnuA